MDLKINQKMNQNPVDLIIDLQVLEIVIRVTIMLSDFKSDRFRHLNSDSLEYQSLTI